MEKSKRSKTTKEKNKTANAIHLELSKTQKDDLLEAFNMLDAEGTGLIGIREISVALRALGFDPSASELRQILLSYDKENKGVEFKSFLELMTKKMTERDPNEELVKAFRIMDKDNTGAINFDDLKRAAKLLGEDINDEEIQEMIDEADRTGSGVVNQQDFIRIIKKATIV
ncbi:Cactin [Clonorchis sinensis]|uniref:Cactin n=1 Tax=Clonorchis sinensis TaxID=79923 RepID=A0A8T1MN39_CLOSI|nr:Cactin [Clonorchis sinensis]